MGALPDGAEPHTTFPTILVLDFGSQYTHLIVRRLREFNVYSELFPCTTKLTDLKFRPVGLILSGGPYSVYDEAAPHVDSAYFDLSIPILGICYGLQELAYRLSRKNVVAGLDREYGQTELTIKSMNGDVDRLFQGIEVNMKVWMSHGDKLAFLPEGFHTIATTGSSEHAAIAHNTQPIYGIQFHPEVTRTYSRSKTAEMLKKADKTDTPNGTKLLKNFATDICGATQNWTMGNFVGQEITRIRKLIGPKAQVLGAVSGGVDSTVAAKLLHEAIGSRFTGIFVDNGFLRLSEREQVQKDLTEHLKINLTVVDASEAFYKGLRGVTDPEEKRKIIGAAFIDVFEAEAKKIEEKAATNIEKAGKVEWFLQGTLYPDVIESLSFKGPSQTIKTHHNVGGLPKRMTEGRGLKILEPLRELFKDEVRDMGRQLGIAEHLVMRHPFPGPGLAIRILGDVTPERVEILRKVDHIFISMIREAQLYNKIGQAFAALDLSRAVGVMGDKRVYENIVLLRAVETTDYMTASPYPFSPEFLTQVSTRIINSVHGVCRVAYDYSGKPPSTIEFE